MTITTCPRCEFFCLDNGRCSHKDCPTNRPTPRPKSSPNMPAVRLVEPPKATCESCTGEIPTGANFCPHCGDESLVTMDYKPLHAIPPPPPRPSQERHDRHPPRKSGTLERTEATEELEAQKRRLRKTTR